jgi:hypothetical protein
MKILVSNADELKLVLAKLEQEIYNAIETGNFAVAIARSKQQTEVIQAFITLTNFYFHGK